jgi:signal transduction histidine kinase
MQRDIVNCDDVSSLTGQGVPVLRWFEQAGSHLDMGSHFVRLLDAIPDPAYIKDATLRYVYINAAGADAAGLQPSAIIGKTDSEIFDPATVEHMTRNDREVMAADGPVAVHETISDLEGNTRHYRSTKCALRNATGQVIGLYGISSDHTERRELFGALRERLKEKHALYNITRCLGQVDVPIEKRLEQVTAYLPHGWQYPEFTRARLTIDGSIYATPTFAPSPSMLSSIITRFDTPIGLLEVSLVGTAPGDHKAEFLPEEQELLDRVASAISEAVERKRLEEQYAQSQKLESIGRLAGAVAHDFNNILSIVLGNAESMLDALDEGTTPYADLSEIVAAAERAAALNRQLLAFSRQDAAKPVLVDLNACVDEMLKMLSRLLPKDKALTAKLSPEPLKIWIDPVQCHQILTNLVVNARDAIVGAGRIVIETAARALDQSQCIKNGEYEPGDYALLSVSDTGMGMSHELQAQIFEPFFTTKPEGKGTGLGLATVYGIVRQNAGFIQVYSEVGKGSTFNVFFPLRAGETWKRPATQSPEKIARGTETVLLVEDDPQILRLQERSISLLGYTVLAAGTPTRALQIAREHPGGIDILISDMMMPEMTGYELFEELSSRQPTLRCLFTSGYPANVILDSLQADDGVRFLQKPFSRQALAEKIREALK